MVSRHPATHEGISDTRPGKVVGFGVNTVVVARTATARARMRKRIVLVGKPIVSSCCELVMELDEMMVKKMGSANTYLYLPMLNARAFRGL
jgi:hypothetical protein